MAVRRLADRQPEAFAFTAASRALADREIAKFPPGRQHSAVIGLLFLAQQQAGGWLPEPAIRHVAEILNMPYIRALEVATFYTMFNLAPVGRKAHVQVCGTTPCMLRGSEDLKAVCRERIAHEQYEVSADGDFSWVEIECAGACVNAPMVQIGADNFEDLTPQSFRRLLDDIAAGRPVRPGPQVSRQFAAPAAGFTSLTESPLRAPTPQPAPAAPPVAAPTKPVEPAPAAAAKPATPVPPPPAPAVTPPAVATATPTPAAPAPTTAPASFRALSAARGGKADDLKVIVGIGPKIEAQLNGIGVFHFDQIAGWGEADIAWVDHNVSFPGRVLRDDWIGQARKLAAGPGGKGN